MSLQQKEQLEKTTIEDDIHDLEVTEDVRSSSLKNNIQKLLRILNIVKEVTEHLSDRSYPTSEVKSLTRALTLEYYKTVDVNSIV